ncbi:MAG: 50S ribosomal protein L9 [Candidatus Eisenbacteria bacterium]|nr:50S ribosomal protein L9 [Candidatus Eisenbacteria bacterium]
MHVILLEDLSGVGSKGATVNVKPGFARNYLLPKRLAIASCTRAANLYQELARQNQAQREKLVAAARAEAAKLDGVEVNVPAQANEEDTLFGSVTSAEVAEALARAGHIVDKRRIELGDHIKQLGRYDVTVKVGHGVEATIKVWVVRA